MGFDEKRTGIVSEQIQDVSQHQKEKKISGFEEPFSDILQV